MRIAFMGSGGLGGYFGARLCDGGADVHFIARGKHLQAMRSEGLRVEGPEPITPDDEFPKRASLADFLRCLPDFVRLGVKDARAEKILRRHEKNTLERI